jgi:hypothetical protein
MRISEILKKSFAELSLIPAPISWLFDRASKNLWL